MVETSQDCYWHLCWVYDHSYLGDAPDDHCMVKDWLVPSETFVADDDLDWHVD